MISASAHDVGAPGLAARWSVGRDAGDPPRYRRGRLGPSSHFVPGTGELRYPGRGLVGLPAGITLFARLVAQDVGPEQRLVATASCGGGLALALGGGTLRLHKGGVGWVDGRLVVPAGAWVACAVAYQVAEGHAHFFLYDYAAGALRESVAVEGSPVREGDGIATLNGRRLCAGFVGALAAPGLDGVAWSRARFLEYAGRPPAGPTPRHRPRPAGVARRSGPPARPRACPIKPASPLPVCATGP